MKKMIKTIMALGLVAGLALVLAAESGATSYTFSSNDGSRGVKNDLNDLDHYKLYVWGIDPTAALNSIRSRNEVIVGARINFTNIYNWANETDLLKVYLVDNPKVPDPANAIDVWFATDQNSNGMNLSELTDLKYRSTGTDYRFSAIYNLWEWTDVTDLKHNRTADGRSYGHDLQYTFDALAITELLQYLALPNSLSGYPTFGLGFDPDCHYYNDGITFTIETAPVPEPGTIVLLGAGLLGLGIFGRRRAAKK